MKNIAIDEASLLIVVLFLKSNDNETQTLLSNILGNKEKIQEKVVVMALG